jgi:hypothetical protein
MMALVNRTAAAQQTLMEASTKISILPYLTASTKAGVAYQGGTNIGFTNDVTNGTWASLATNTTTSTYAQYRNGAEKVNSTVTLTGTGVFSAMTLGGSNYLNSPADDFILATSTFTDAQILALHTYLISDVS